MAQAKNSSKSTTKSTDKSTAKQAEKKTTKKKTESSIDVRMFAVPERRENVERIQKILDIPDDHIVWDEEHIGAMPTAKKTWSIETDKPFVMVMNDDAELCKDFMKYCTKIIELHPNYIISLFPWQFRTRKQVRNRPRRSPYVQTKEVMGLAVIMKTEYIKPCLESWSDEFGDDVNITRWAIANNIPILTTLPSIIQHIGKESFNDPTRVLRGTDFFNPDPKDENWDDGFVTSWSNVTAG